jgi:hypothetical protein
VLLKISDLLSKSHFGDDDVITLHPCPPPYHILCVRLLAQSIAIYGVLLQRHSQVQQFTSTSVLCNSYSPYDVAGDLPVLLGVTRVSKRSLVSYSCSYIAFRQKIRKDALEQRAIADEDAFRKNLNVGREIANFLRKNIVQAERLQKIPGEDDSETYSTCKWPFFCIIF